MNGPGQFPSTRHSLILAVRQPELRAEALASIIEIYWKPAYKYIRLKWGKSRDDAEDLTQDFFAGLLDRDLLSHWDPAKAPFRSYLRLCIDGHAKNQLTAASRLKRGGGERPLSLDFALAEREIEVADGAISAEDLFHREWQRHMFELAIADLRRACETNGRETQFRIFERYDLVAEGDRPSYDELSVRYGVPSTTVTNHLAWARRELRRLLLERLARTAAGGAELRKEAAELLRTRRSL